VAGEPDHRPGEEARAAAGLVVQHRHIDEPGVVVDADMDELPADAVVLARGVLVTQWPGLLKRASFFD
jgi:hypothetical protein